MSRSWNGADLVTEFSQLLGDVSTSFQSKVLEWINDIQLDISSRHDWSFHRVKGKKILTASAEEHTLYTAAPGAPTVAINTGGSLTEDSVYKVVVTFYEESTQCETKAGTESSEVTATATDKTIDVTGIPVSSEPLVTARKIYLIKDGGAPLFIGTISDNTTTTYTITADATSTIEAPDYTCIRELDGSPFLETSSQLDYKSFDQLRLLFQGQWSSGTPSYWSDMGPDRILLYPTPSSALTLSFYYYRMPHRVYNESTSQPDIPPWLKPALKAGVVAMGFEYRDRDGQENKRSNYEDILKNTISRKGSSIRTPMRVRDVMGDSDGFEV